MAENTNNKFSFISGFPKGFKPFLLSQFLGALNDNTFKLIVSLFVATSLSATGAGIAYVCLSQIFFALPYLLFSSWAGVFADRNSKSRSISLFKIIEIVIMGLGAICLSFGYHNLLLILLFLMGTQSAFVSPAKYGLLPEVLDENELSRGNGVLEFITFVAIIIGTSLGSFLKAFSGGSYLFTGSILVTLAVIGYISSLKIPKLSPQNPEATYNLNPFKSLIPNLKEVKENKELYFVFIAISFFWFIASYIQLTSMVYISSIRPESFDISSGIFLTSLALGIGSGSIIAGVVSHGKVELGLVPIGMAGITLGTFLTVLLGGYFYLGVIFSFISGFFAGMYIVPLDSFLQANSPKKKLGEFIACSNFLSFSAVILGATSVWVFNDILNLGFRSLFFFVSFLSLIFTIVSIKQMPELLIRCINWLVINIFYKIEVDGLENVPQKGGALIVCNHVSYADASIILARIKRPVRFLIYKPIYNQPLIKLIAGTTNAIPIAANDNPKETVKALKTAREAVESGEVVCIFAEGALTRVGNLLPFNKGLEKIVKGLNEPIIPACLDQLWGSIFSYSGGEIIRKFPVSIPYKLNLSFGEPLPSSSKSWEVRQRVQELQANANIKRNSKAKHLQLRFASSALKHPLRACLEDSSGKKLNYFKTLVSSIIASKKLRSLSEEQFIGVCLPSSTAGVLTNIAILLSGKTPVNLNYTASADALKSSIEQCKIDKIISSKEFLEKIPGEFPKEELTKVKELKELFESSLPQQILASAEAALLGLFGFNTKKYRSEENAEESIATIIFSSGSTGEPKGVKLSHANISANLESLYSIFQLGKEDSLIGVLPLFHAFGFTGTFWLPLLSGCSAYYHPNPLESAKIGELVRENKHTILMSTPTFLTGYLRRCKKEDFKTLRYVIVGAEKLSEKLSASFGKRFGIIPLEGYGATELSPVAIMNVHDFEDEYFKQTGNKPGTVGHPLPGIAVKILDIDSGENLPPEESGLLAVKGPNVMKGYLNNEEKTKEVIKDGWYHTGDVAKFDKDGFVTITDRLARFSKIGGEMVPHIKIEEAVLQAAGKIISKELFENLELAVSAVPDEKKGEKIVVISNSDLNPDEIIKNLKEQELPNLWIPKKDSFIKVGELPMLGTGKKDLKKIKSIALDKVNSK